MDKIIVNKIKELKTNEREMKMSNMVHHTLTQEEWTTQRHIEKQNRTRFNPWSIGVIRVVGKKFHNNFKARFWMSHPLVYNGYNLGVTSKHQQMNLLAGTRGPAKNSTSEDN